MPLTLILRSSSLPAGTPSPELTFDGPRVVVGRGPGCDVRLPDPSVSHRHATFRATDNEWTLLDEGSTNGTFVGDATLPPRTPRVIKGGEHVRVGRVWLETRVDQTPPTRDLKFATRDLALALVSQAMRALGANADTALHVTDGPDSGRTLLLVEEGRLYTIGRDDTCELALRDPDASRTHARVVRRGGTVLVRDAGSKNGAWLGEERLSPDRDVAWKGGALLVVGGSKIALEEPAVVALAELEAAEDEAMSPEDVTEPPAPTSSRVDLGPAAAPPVAAPPVRPPAPSKPASSELRKSGSRWTAVDVAVVFAALAVIGLSFVGLWWLLRY